MVLHYLPERPGLLSGGAATDAAGVSDRPGGTLPAGPRAGFVVGKAVGNSVVRHRVTRRLRAVVRAELHRLPPTADLVVRARPEAADAESRQLRRDLRAGLDRLLPERVPSA
jgi:ribonuclease P protein component